MKTAVTHIITVTIIDLSIETIVLTQKTKQIIAFEVLASIEQSKGSKVPNKIEDHAKKIPKSREVTCFGFC